MILPTASEIANCLVKNIILLSVVDRRNPFLWALPTPMTTSEGMNPTYDVQREAYPLHYVDFVGTAGTKFT